MYFTLILFFMMLLTGIVWFLERLYFLPKRRLYFKKILKELDFDNSVAPNSSLAQENDIKLYGMSSKVPIARILPQELKKNWWFDFMAGLFPAIFFVFFFRSFFLEPFKIPSSSMLPTLHVGDFILVNKFTYGVRLPILNRKLIEVGKPKSGDVIVFRYPKDESIDYIKRVVGLPGETILYKNKELYVNGVPVQTNKLQDFYDAEHAVYDQQYEETLKGRSYRVLKKVDAMSLYQPRIDFPFRKNCEFNINEVICKVPDGHYFVMGDNRDNSADSRYWGFVPEKNLIGRAFFVWFNLSKLSRIGKLR